MPAEPMEPPPRNAREAHAAGKVWVEVRVNGGPVELDGRKIGRFRLKMAMTTVHALAVWAAANWPKASAARRERRKKTPRAR